MSAPAERRARRMQARRRSVRRRRLTAGVVLVAGLTLALALVLGGAPARPHTRARAPSYALADREAPARPAKVGPAAAATRVAPPGSLPQTHAEPPAGGAPFAARLAALWTGVVTGSTARAMPAFFPERAYAQVKDEPAPETDWQERLVGDFGLDVQAAHQLLGAGAASASLIAVHSDRAYAHWVEPGACYNRVGYWELPNARLVYRTGGAVRSFGIASLISWRGEWYVVHLGAVEREGGAGAVDAPSAGEGASVDSGTC